MTAFSAAARLCMAPGSVKWKITAGAVGRAPGNHILRTVEGHLVYTPYSGGNIHGRSRPSVPCRLPPKFCARLTGEERLLELGAPFLEISRGSR